MATGASGLVPVLAVGNSPARDAGRTHRRWWAGAAGLAAIELLILYWPTLQWLFERWTMSVWQHAHGLMIPPLVAYLVYRELAAHRGAERQGSAWGFVLVVPALALHALDAGMHTELLSAASLVLLIPGLALLTLGTRPTRAIAFPLAFLAFALPIPLALTEQLHWQLRLIATAAASGIVPLFGVPVFVEGTTIHMPHGALEVADACSGFSTLYAALAVACLVAYAAPTARQRAIVLLSAAPLAIAANAVRVVSLVLLVVWKGEPVLDTFIHPLSGILTFALALPVIIWLGEDRTRPTPALAAARQ